MMKVRVLPGVQGICVACPVEGRKHSQPDQELSGSYPDESTQLWSVRASVAQMAEQRPFKSWVVGSSPTRGTSKGDKYEV